MTERGVRGGVAYMPTAPVITLASRHSLGGNVRVSGSGAAASGASPFAANDLLAFPFVLTAPSTPVYKGFWVNGSAAGNNISIAVYTADFVLLGQTASTGATGNTTAQAATLALTLGPGMYYAAMAHDSATTGHFFRWAGTTAAFWKLAGCWREASVTLATLPNPATPVACNNTAFPVFGLITRSGFDA